jgi:choline monooxygenase
MTRMPQDWLAPTRLDVAVALPAPLYTDAAAYETERRVVFARSWQLVAHAGDLAGAGDHVVAEIAGLPIVVVRGGDGVLRAFHNVCRHRAGPLALCNGKGANALRCKYHGWTYTLEGRLRAATEMQDARDFDVGSISLPEVQVDAWRGLVFVAAERAPPLAEVLAGIDARLRGRRLDDLVFARRISYEVACNWKTYVDNYLEGYHLPHVHPGLNRLLDYRSYDTVLDRWHSLQFSPLEGGGDNFYGAGEALYYFVYPNTMLNILPGRLQTNRVVPLGVDRCRVDFDYFYPPAATDEEAQRRAQDLSFSDDVQHEDIAICEAVQKGLASGSYVAGRLNPKRESGVHHFHELLRAALRDA